MENNQAKGASKWLTSRRLIDFYPLFFFSIRFPSLPSLCLREGSVQIYSFFKLKKKEWRRGRRGGRLLNTHTHVKWRRKKEKEEEEERRNTLSGYLNYET